MIIFNIIFSIHRESRTSRPLWIHYKHGETTLSHTFEHDQIIEYLRKTPILVLKQFILYKLTVLTPLNKYPDIFLNLEFFSPQIFCSSDGLHPPGRFRPTIPDVALK